MMALSSATPSGDLRGTFLSPCDHAGQVPAVLVFVVVQLSMSYVLCASVQFLDRVVDIPVGYLVGDAQCTLCRGPWSSTGPVPGYGVDVPVVVQRQVLWLSCECWFDSGYMFCVFTWWVMEEFHIFST